MKRDQLPELKSQAEIDREGRSRLVPLIFFLAGVGAVVWAVLFWRLIF